MIPRDQSIALVAWFCGLPGSGKSTIARGVFERIRNNKIEVGNKGHSRAILVEMDSIRRKIISEPTYSDQERDTSYRSFVLIGSFLSKGGVTALLDGTGHKKIWRDFARRECSNFVEVYVNCPIEICIQRETSRTSASGDIRQKLYLDALERLKNGKKIQGLGKVPGVDEPFEESDSPEIVIDSSRKNPDQLVDQAVNALSRFDPELFGIGNCS